MFCLTEGFKNIDLAKLFASFLILGSFIMVLASFFQLFLVANIIRDANFGARTQVLASVNGLQINLDLASNTNAQLGLLLPPLAKVMFWFGVFVLGVWIYSSRFLRAEFKPSEKTQAEKEIIGKRKKK
ncbi:MAG: hypothetical protein QW735_01725 [archaeon]